MPQARGLLDHQILVRVVVVHGIGVVEVHAADGVHQLAHGLPLHYHLIVRLKAHQLGNLLVQRLDTPFPAAVVKVDGVDFLHIPRDVDHGVPGNGHHRGLLVGHVVTGQQHGVRVAAAAGIQPQDQHGVEVLALALTAGPGTDALAVINLLDLLRAVVLLGEDGAAPAVVQIRAGKDAPPRQHTAHRHCQNRRHGDHDLLLFGKPAGLFRFWGFLFQAVPTRVSLFSFH